MKLIFPISYFAAAAAIGSRSVRVAAFVPPTIIQRATFTASTRSYCQTLFMAAPEYGARQVKFGIEDKDVLKDISKKDNVIFVDVRNPNEISESPSACSGFVAGKFLLEEDCAPDDVSKELPNKDAHHIVFCAIGGRASTACQKLREFGYSNVYNAGGVGDLDLFLD